MLFRSAKFGVFARAALLLSSTVATGGLDSGTDEVGRSFMFILFLVMWLVTVYLVRHFMAGHKLKLRDALYNALAPLISTLIVLIVVLIQASAYPQALECCASQSFSSASDLPTAHR